MTVPEVVSVGRRTGRAELDEHAEGVHFSEIDIDLKRSSRPKDAVAEDIRRHLAVLPASAQCRTADFASARSHAVRHPR